MAIPSEVPERSYLATQEVRIYDTRPLVLHTTNLSLNHWGRHDP
jgi:hypothetical protein